MIRFDTLATVHYQHLPEEVAELSAAIVPLAENIKAVAATWERDRLRDILACKQFRYRDAKAVKNMLGRAAKHAKANLGDYFPEFQQGILIAAKNLEEAVACYWAEFEEQQREIIPIS